jgi:hypothetical protein
MLPNFRNDTPFSAGPGDSHVRLSSKNNVYKKTGMEHWWNDTDRRKSKYSEKKSLSQCHCLSTTNLTWTDLGLNLGLNGKRPEPLKTNMNQH